MAYDGLPHVPVFASIAYVTSVLFLMFAAGDIRPGEGRLSEERERMVREQVENRGIRNVEVLRAMRATPRHLFIPAVAQPMAYEDGPLSIGYGATISQPYIVALMTELLDPQKNDRVLEIGTGSGYQAAVLAQLVQRVYTIEIVPELAKSAGDTLAKLGYKNVTVRHGDGFLGWPEKAPFNRIILTAAPKEVPPSLIDQLAPGGRLVAPAGPRHSQELVVVDKKRDGRIVSSLAGSVSFVPMVRGPR